MTDLQATIKALEYMGYKIYTPLDVNNILEDMTEGEKALFESLKVNKVEE